jgi:hypothetical protein
VIGDHDEPRCPKCGSLTWWELQDTYKLGQRIFSERRQVCERHCGWFGCAALFPWRGNKDMTVYIRAIPLHPGEDTVPMLDPAAEVKP